MSAPTTTEYGPRERRALAAVATQFWINGMVFASFVPRLPEVRDAIDVDLETIGLLLSLAALGGLVGSALTGPAIERLGTKRVMTFGAIPIVAAVPLIGFTSSAAVFVAALVVIQICDVAVDVAMNIQGSRLSKARTAPIMNRLHGVWSLGTVAGSLAATQVARLGVPLSTHLAVVAVILAVTIGFVAPRLLPDDGAPAPEEEPERPAAGWRRRLGNAVLWRFGLVAGAAMMVELVTSDWAAFRLADDLGLADGPAGYGFVAFMVGMLVGRFGGDHVLERIGSGHLFRVAVAISSTGLAIATLTPTGAPGAAALVVGGYGIAGLGVSVIFPRLYDEAAQSSAGPAVMGALTAGQRITLIFAPLLVGALAGTSLAVGSALAIVVLPAGVVLFLLGRH